MTFTVRGRLGLTLDEVLADLDFDSMEHADDTVELLERLPPGAALIRDGVVIQAELKDGTPQRWARDVLGQAGILHTGDGFRVGPRCDSAAGWDRNRLELAAWLFENGLALEADVEDALHAMRLLEG